MGSVLGPEGICSKVVKEVHHGGHGPIFRILSWDWIGPNHISSKHRVCVASWLQKIRQWSKFTAGILLFAIYNRQFLHTYLHDNNVPYVAFYIIVIQVWFENWENQDTHTFTSVTYLDKCDITALKWHTFIKLTNLH